MPFQYILANLLSENEKAVGVLFLRLLVRLLLAVFGRVVVLLALHRLKERGFRDAMLATEDFRIPAIRLYMSLGFTPMIVHWTHRLRWKKIMKELERYLGSKE